jgi:predicted metal-dependent enzyme (double-stranded beta helix superfamily)
MFDVDTFLSDCEQAVAEADAPLAIRDVLQRAMADPAAVEHALPITCAEIVPLLVRPDLTVLKVVWAPGMAIPPHDHLMWVAIGLYGGQEDNAFYRRVGTTGIVASGGKRLGTSDVALLGDDTIHAVTNPARTFTGALHVYGGDLVHRGDRTEWPDPTAPGVPYDFSHTRRYFDDANATS